MKISRLRLLGFKSFVEPADLVIEAGLTGVVGPNGCGKSNLLEALRWVMGETSHKSMRAAAMDDVIFSGTTARPERNMAEVTLFLDNSERKAPAEFNGSDEIEITRRIEREAGSAYRINGREARARDIKILFEDAATGARSPALVRQGQIAEVVNAKPDQRRRILEDAAGIAGLHSRRHDAELRLRAAEGNLARIGDVLGGLTSQIESLKRQARQARRYKEMSAEIRRSEALLAYLNWQEAHDQVCEHEGALTGTLSKAAAATAAESQAVLAESAAADVLQPLRETEAGKGAALARLRIEHDNFEREAARAVERERDLRARAEQLDADINRENTFVAEARDILQRLDAEVAQLAEAEGGAELAEETARAALNDLTANLAKAEARLTDLTTRAAETRARKKSLSEQAADRREAAAKVERHLVVLATQAREAAAKAPDALKLVETTTALDKLAAHCGTLEKSMLTAEARTRELTFTAQKNREVSEQARLAASALRTERETLARLVLPDQQEGATPIADGLTVATGYEAALGAAFGDDLEASIDGEAPVHWRLLELSSHDGQLPSDVEPLSHHVEAPPELMRSLRQTGVVAEADGARLQQLLKPGQRLVSREGGLWRWDGFVAAADGATPAAQRIAGRNRLKAVTAKEREAEAIAGKCAEDSRHAAEAMTTAEATERAVRQQWREAQAQLLSSREALTYIEKAAQETEGRLQALAEAKAIADDALIEAATRADEVNTALTLLDEEEDLEPLVARAQSDTSQLRNAAGEARAKLSSLERERGLRAERLQAAKTENFRWTSRSTSASEQIASLAERHDGTLQELEQHSGQPAEIERRREALLSELTLAEEARQEAADRLAEAETAARAAVQALRAAQLAVAAEREAGARHETKLEAARARRQDEARRIRETFEVAPEHCLKLAEFETGKPMPLLADVDRSLQKLKGDRERLGGVNLQADDELTVLQEQHAGLDTERNDVEQAIAKLRTAIGQLNREGKKRLDDAFETVNGHFQRLFTSLFNGGEARLEMINADDPLEGGLEIIAKPPGKKPATLSLLSGGEQTLTAMSLIFAVFLTNPSPICVLDEVDAPLDDSNVDRFCSLMEKMAAETDTRFLVITHHPMTMTRMNRLFGVTMAEKGISQLVSVDLETAQSFREAG